MTEDLTELRRRIAALERLVRTGGAELGGGAGVGLPAVVLRLTGVYAAGPPKSYTCSVYPLGRYVDVAGVWTEDTPVASSLPAIATYLATTETLTTGATAVYWALDCGDHYEIQPEIWRT